MRTRGYVVTKKPLKPESSSFPPESMSKADSEGFDDGVTLDLSIADVSQLTNPTGLQSKEDPSDFSINDDDSSEKSSSGQRTVPVETEGHGPSEASSSQTSEAAAPLIALTMKRFSHSDDGSRSFDRANKWEPIAPAIDERGEETPQSNLSRGSITSSRGLPVNNSKESSMQDDGRPMDEAAWDLRNIISSFPSSSPVSSGFEVDPFEVTPHPMRNSKTEPAKNKVENWQPFHLGDFSPPRSTRQPIIEHNGGDILSTSQRSRPFHSERSEEGLEPVAPKTHHSSRRIRSPPAPISTRRYRTDTTTTNSIMKARSSPTLRESPKERAIFRERNPSQHAAVPTQDFEQGAASPSVSGRISEQRQELDWRQGAARSSPPKELIARRRLTPTGTISQRSSPTSLGSGRGTPSSKELDSIRRLTPTSGISLHSTPTSMVNDRSTPTGSHVSFRFDEIPVVRESASLPGADSNRENSSHHSGSRLNTQQSVTSEGSSSSKHAALLLRLRSSEGGEN